MTSIKARVLFRRWRRRSARLLEAVGLLLRRCRAEGEPEQVHQLRVTLRRLRLMLRLGAACSDKRSIVEFRHWSRAVSDALGPLRDLDVTSEWLRDRRADPAVIASLQRRRHRCWESCACGLPAPPKGLERRLTRWKARRKTPARVMKLYSRFAQLHEDEVARVGSRLFDLAPPERHSFRRTLRRWRYLRELALSRRQQRSDRLLKLLVRLQEALGEYQNRLVAQTTLRQVHPPARLRGLRESLVEESRQWESATRRQLCTLTRTQGWRLVTFSGRPETGCPPSLRRPAASRFPRKSTARE